MLRGDGKAVDVLEPERASRRRLRQPPPLGCDRLEKVLGARVLRADDVDEGAEDCVAEGVDVARQQPAAGAGLTADQHGDVGQVWVEDAQQLRELEVGEPAGEAVAEHVPGRALRERQWVAATAANRRVNDLAQGPGVGRIGENDGAEGVEEGAGAVDVARLGQEDPARARLSGGEAVGELELHLEVVREAEQDHVRRRGAVELRITGGGEHRLLPRGGEARQGGSKLRFAMDDPQGGHGLLPGFERRPVRRTPTSPRSSPPSSNGNPRAKRARSEREVQLRREPSEIRSDLRPLLLPGPTRARVADCFNGVILGKKMPSPEAVDP